MLRIRLSNRKIIFALATAFAIGSAACGTASPPQAPASEVQSYSQAHTQYVEVKGVRFAYRRIGTNTGVPLVLLTHFRGSMDNWDPALLDAIARERTVIAFDNKGVASTGGTVPPTYGEMADDAADFITALGYTKVDILGFSIGGMIAQELLFNHSDLVRKAVLTACMPPGGKGLVASKPEISARATKPVVEPEDFLVLFFSPSPESQAAGRAFLARRTARAVDVEPATSAAVMQSQGQARKAWADMDEAAGIASLKAVRQPVLIANGHDDVMIPTSYSFSMYQNLPNGELMLYPNSGHGFLFQYSDQFAKQISLFLGAP